MSLLIFSERDHIIPMRKGKKLWTTRPKRKIPIPIGGKLQCYFKSRMKKNTCFNCISEKCLVQPFSDNLYKDAIANRAFCKQTGCLNPWTNFFGEAILTHIDHCWDTQNWKEDTEDEIYILKFCDMIEEEPDFCETWAIGDGFPKGFKQADEWFTKKHGVDWKNAEYDILYYEPLWELIPL